MVVQELAPTTASMERGVSATSSTVQIILRAIGALPTTVISRMTKVDSRPIVSLGVTTRAHTMAGSLPSIFFLVVQELVTTTASMVRVVSAMSSTVLIILRAIG